MRTRSVGLNLPVYPPRMIRSRLRTRTDTSLKAPRIHLSHIRKVGLDSRVKEIVKTILTRT